MLNVTKGKEGMLYIAEVLSARILGHCTIERVSRVGIEFMLVSKTERLIGLTQFS